MGLINLAFGLSEAGKAIASSADEYGLAAQKSDLETQKIALAEQMRLGTEQFTQGQENARNQARIDAESQRAADARAQPDYGEKGIGVNPATQAREIYQLDKRTGKPSWTGITPDPNIEFVNGTAVDKDKVVPGTVIPDPHLPIQQQQADAATKRADAEAQRAGQDNYGAPTMIGFAGPDGEEVQKAAIYNKKAGQYIDAETMQPIASPKNLRVIGNATGGGRSMAMAGRVSTAALDAASDLENLSGIGTGGNMGLFGTTMNTPMGALKRAVLTTQQAQDTQTTMAGLSRAMSLLGSGGMQGSDEVMKSFTSLQPQAGDTMLTTMRKLGSFRQQSVNGIDSALASPMYSPSQKKQLEAAKDKIVSAIPWEPHDVQVLENKGETGLSMHDVFGAKLGTPPAQQRINPALRAPQNGQAGTQASPPEVLPTRPANAPPGSAYSPSRRQWRTPDGTILDATGQRIQ
jgi:hypothetical protein